MENKYYRPNLEDLYIEYECEICTNYGYTIPGKVEEDWVPVKIRYEDENFMWDNELDDILFGMWDGYQPVRTKYLTQEDIESLGWKCKGKSIDIWFEKEGEFQQSSWTSYKAILQYGLHDKRMVITLEDPGYNPTIFNGIVPSINEFKKLTKLLGI